MPVSFKREGDGRRVICNQTGRHITEAVTAQTSARTGQSYTIRKAGVFGIVFEKTIKADIRIA